MKIKEVWKSNCEIVFGFESLKTKKNLPAGIYFFKVNNGNTRTMCEIISNLTMRIPERRQWRRSSVFINNFEQIHI